MLCGEPVGALRISVSLPLNATAKMFDLLTQRVRPEWRGQINFDDWCRRRSKYLPIVTMVSHVPNGQCPSFLGAMGPCVTTANLADHKA